MPGLGTAFARGSYAKGRRVSAEVAVDQGDTRITAMIDRSDLGAVASGRRVAQLWIEVTYDGATWQRIGGCETHGGTIADVDAGGAPLTYSSCTFMLRERASTVRRARVVWESDEDVTAEVLLVTEVTGEKEPSRGRPPRSVAIDDTNIGSGNGVSSVSIASFAVANNSNRMLFATYFANSSNGSNVGTVTGVTWNTSENFTQVSGIATLQGTDRIDAWRLLAPTATTATATMSLSTSNNRAIFGLLSLYNVDQTTPLGTGRVAVGTTGTTFAIGCEGDTNGLSIGWFGNHYAGTGQTIASRDGTPYYIAAGTASQSAGATGLTPTGAPAGRLYGDVEFCSIANENNNAISCSGSGWTKLGSTVQQDATWQQEIWYRIYDGSNVDPAFTWSGSVGCSARRWLMRDLNMTDLEGFHATNSGSGSTHSTTGQNTTANLSRVMYVDHAEANTAIAQPSGWTENFDAGSATGPYRLAVGGKDVPTSGTGSGNISVTGAAASWVQRQIELLAATAQTHEAEVEALADGCSGAFATEPGAVYNTFAFTGNATPDNWLVAAISVKPATGGGGGEDFVTPAVASAAATAPAGTFALAQKPAVAAPAGSASTLFSLLQIPGIAAPGASASAVFTLSQIPGLASAAASALDPTAFITRIVIPAVATGAGSASVVWTLAQIPTRADVSALATALYALGQTPTRAEAQALASSIYALVQVPGRAEAAFSASALASIATIIVPAVAQAGGAASAAWILAQSPARAEAAAQASAAYVLFIAPARADAQVSAEVVFALAVTPEVANLLASAIATATIEANVPVPGVPRGGAVPVTRARSSPPASGAASTTTRAPAASPSRAPASTVTRAGGKAP